MNKFINAQTPVYETALSELRAGHKQTHWMWFIFPQIDGLGRSKGSSNYCVLLSGLLPKLPFGLKKNQ